MSSIPFASRASGDWSGEPSTLGPGVDHQGGDTVASGAEPDLSYYLLLQGESRVAAGNERGGERDNGRAVDVIVHHGLGKRLYQAGLYLEALGRRDVLEVYPPERRREPHGLDELVTVFGIMSGHRRNPASCGRKRLALHDGIERLTDIPTPIPAYRSCICDAAPIIFLSRAERGLRLWPRPPGHPWVYTSRYPAPSTVGDSITSFLPRAEEPCRAPI